MEYVDIYTAERKLTGVQKIKGSPLGDNEFILIAHLVIFNSRGEMLIQRRKEDKKDWPGCWDITSGGGVIAAKIAAHIGYSARKGDFERDRRMSSERIRKGCLGDINSALFPTEVYNELVDERICSMCGEYCPLKKQRNKENK